MRTGVHVRTHTSAMNEILRQPQLKAHCPDLVLEQKSEWLHQFEWHRLW